MALLERDRYEVTRHVYPLTGDQLRPGGPDMISRDVPADQLGEQFPEFTSPHFAACGDTVDTGD